MHKKSQPDYQKLSGWDLVDNSQDNEFLNEYWLSQSKFRSNSNTIQQVLLEPSSLNRESRKLIQSKKKSINQNSLNCNKTQVVFSKNDVSANNEHKKEDKFRIKYKDLKEKYSSLPVCRYQDKQQKEQFVFNFRSIQYPRIYQINKENDIVQKVIQPKLKILKPLDFKHHLQFNNSTLNQIKIKQQYNNQSSILKIKVAFLKHRLRRATIQGEKQYQEWKEYNQLKLSAIPRLEIQENRSIAYQKSDKKKTLQMFKGNSFYNHPYKLQEIEDKVPNLAQISTSITKKLKQELFQQKRLFIKD